MKKILALMFMFLMVFTLSSVQVQAAPTVQEIEDVTLPYAPNTAIGYEITAYTYDLATDTYTLTIDVGATVQGGTLGYYTDANASNITWDADLLNGTEYETEIDSAVTNGYVTTIHENYGTEGTITADFPGGSTMVASHDYGGSFLLGTYPHMSTQTPTVPTLTYDNITTGSDTLSFDYTINDPDGALTTDGIQYTFGGTTETLTALTGTITETGLEPDTEYTPEIALSYDISDGTGVQTDTYTQSITSKNTIISGIFNTVSAVVLGGIGVMSALFVESGITRVFWAPGDPGHLTLFAWILLLPVGLVLVRWGFMKVLNLIRMRR